MTAFAQTTPRADLSRFLRAPRAEHWLALFLVLAAMALPDCCLTGHHMFGLGMESFSPICRASP